MSFVSNPLDGVYIGYADIYANTGYILTQKFLESYYGGQLNGFTQMDSNVFELNMTNGRFFLSMSDIASFFNTSAAPRSMLYFGYEPQNFSNVPFAWNVIGQAPAPVPEDIISYIEYVPEVPVVDDLVNDPQQVLEAITSVPLDSVTDFDASKLVLPGLALFGFIALVAVLHE